MWDWRVDEISVKMWMINFLEVGTTWQGVNWISWIMMASSIVVFTMMMMMMMMTVKQVVTSKQLMQIENFEN